MYRTPAPPLECSACRSSALTPLTKLDPSEGWLNVLFWPQQSGRDTRTTHKVTVDRARVCLDCGNVMPAVNAQDLAELREAFGRLKPIPE
jgi:hypothetical protein